MDHDSLELIKAWLGERLAEIKPTLAIGIGPCTLASVKSTIAIDQVCKKILPNTPIVYGGPLVLVPGLEWFFFEYLNAYAVIPGDGEIALASLLEKLKSNQKRQIRGISYEPNMKLVPIIAKDIDNLPFPARDLFDHGRYFLSTRRDLYVYPFAGIVCSRGCPHECGFCSSSTMRKGHQSIRSLNNISEEIRMLTTNMGVKSIVFYDDCSFSNESTINEEITEFAKMIKSSGKGVVWQIEMRTDVANALTSNSVKKMYQSGCRQINLGIEKGTLKGLKSIGKSTNPEESAEACKTITSSAPNLRLAGTFILGGPGETYDEAMETIEFSKKLGLLFAHFYPLEIYPGTRLYHKKFGLDMRIWLNLVQQDSVFAGSLVYEDILKKDDILELTCKAYKSFYRRKEWSALGKRLLCSHFNLVCSTVFSWGEAPRW